MLTFVDITLEHKPILLYDSHSHPIRFARQVMLFPSKDKETEFQKAELTYSRLKYKKLRLKLRSLDPSLILFPYLLHCS